MIKVKLSSGEYYDATARYGSGGQDFGDYGIAFMKSDDYLFNSYHRQLFLSRFRREEKNNFSISGICSKFPQALGEASCRIKTNDAQYNFATEKWFEDRKKNVFVDGTDLDTELNILMGEMLRAGERFYVKLASGQVRQVPSECCGSGVELRDGEINGIVYNKSGKPIFYKFAPRAEQGTANYAEGKYYSADAVIHVFSKDRSSQGRGLPWMLASLVLARDLYECMRAKLRQVKNLDKLFGVITTEGGKFAQENSLKEFDEGLDVEVTVTNPDANPVLDLRDGTFINLDKGEDVKVLSSSYQAADYKELINIILFAISTPLGLPVELWYGGIADLNYAGFKGIGANWENRRQAYNSFFKTKFLEQVFQFIFDFDVDEKLVKAWPAGQENKFAWNFKSMATLDEERDARAAKLRITAGISDVAKELERRGEWYDEVFEHRRNVYLTGLRAAGVNVGAATEVPLPFIYYGEVTDKKSAKLETKPALIETIGIGGTQALMQVLSAVGGGTLPVQQAVNTLVILFGISAEDAAKMVAAPEVKTAQTTPVS